MTDRALILAVRASIAELGARLVAAGELDAATDLRKRADAWKRACDKRENERLAVLAKTARVETERLERLVLRVELPFHTVAESNKREHWGVKHKERGDLRPLTKMAMHRFAKHARVEIPLPCRVHLVRLAEKKLDPNNLPGAFKAIVDGIADWLGIDDSNEALVRYTYDQEQTRPGKWGVRVEVSAEVPA